MVAETAKSAPPTTNRLARTAHAPSAMYASQSWRSVAPAQFVPYMMKSLAPKMIMHESAVRTPNDRPIAKNAAKRSSGSSSAVTRNASLLAWRKLKRMCATLIHKTHRRFVKPSIGGSPMFQTRPSPAAR